MIQLRQLWHTLTQPSNLITDPDARQRASLLASLVLALIGLGVIALASIFLFEPGFQFWTNATFLIQLAFLFSLFGIYGLSRSRYYIIGAWLTVAIVWVAVIGGTALLPPGENARGYLAYLSAAILLAGILLTAHGLLLVIVVSVIGVLLLPLLPSFQDSEEIFYSAIYTLVIAGLIMVFIRHRERIERQRQAQLANSEKRNRGMLNALPDLMFRLSSDGRYLDFQANNKADLYSASEDFVGQPVELVLPQPVAGMILDNLRLTLETNRLHIFEYELPIEGVVQNFEARMTPSGKDEVVYLVRNITEIKRGETVLRESRERWRSLVENLPGTITHITHDGIILFVNRVALFDSVDSAIGKSIYDVMPPDQQDMVRRKIAQVIKNGMPQSYDISAQSPEGHTLWYSTQAAPIWDRGRVESVLLISTDVTESKTAEESLRTSESRFRAMNDASPFGIFLTDAEGDCLYTNHVYQKMTGLSFDDALGKGWNDAIHPEEREQVFIKWYAAAHAKKPFESIMRYQHQDGTVMWVNVKAVKMQDGDALLGYVGSVEDITERKATQDALSQERNLLRTLIDTIPDFVYVKDTQNRYILTNTAHARSMGCTPNDVVGKMDFDFFPQELAETYVADEQEIFRTGEPLLNHEEVSVKETENLTLMIASTTKVPLRSSTGEIIGLVGITRDITDDKQSESQLEEARDQALEASRLKSEFLATMSHEIRTPMNGVIGMTELLLGTPLNEEQQDYARIVLGEANSLLTIINDILDFSKIEAGKMMVESIEFTLPNVVKRVVDIMQLKGADKGLSVNMTIAPDVPTYVCGDPNRLRQVLLNLMGNAVKFTRRGEVEVHMSLDKNDDDNPLVRFSIHDTGIGLSEVARKRLFQAFTQADGSTTRKYGGTGLGLVISKRLTELMGGQIGVESEEGVGSTFWFTIQFAASAQADPLDLLATDENENQASGDKSDVLILVAEDNPTNQSLALKQLRNLGYRARLVGNGVEAVDEIITHPGQYALILMDCQMPIMDGYEATRLIRAEEVSNGRHIPIVALTASAMMGVRERCMAAGMDDYLSKPVSLEALQAAIEQCLVGKR